MNFTTIDRILSKLYSELRGTDLNETDLIEWIGEALEFLKVYKTQAQYVSILSVENYQTKLPIGFQNVLQVARFNDDYEEDFEKCLQEFKDVDESEEEPKIVVNNCDPCPDCYKPYFDMQWQYIDWTQHFIYKRYFTPVRLSNHTLFNTLVCKEKDFEQLYSESCSDEYTIVGVVNRHLRFSFKKGVAALAYLGVALDSDTGYPLVPDHISFITAVSHYVKFKIAERLDWNGRQGYAQKMKSNYDLWLKYARQAKNYAKMPKTIDEYQNNLERSHNLIPNHNSYYNYFGNLGREQHTRM